MIMKKILLIITSLLFVFIGQDSLFAQEGVSSPCFTIKKNDLKTNNLNGKVKEMTTKYYTKDNKNEDTIGKTYISKYLYQEFDKEGFQTKYEEQRNETTFLYKTIKYFSKTSSKEEKTFTTSSLKDKKAKSKLLKRNVIAYDADGNINSSFFYDSNSHNYNYYYDYIMGQDTVLCYDYEKDSLGKYYIDSKNLNVFDKKGNLIEDGNYKMDSSWHCKCTFSYDKDNNQVGCMAMINAKDMEFKKVMQYNKDNQKEIEYVYLSDEENYYSKTIYKYDNQGNWIQSITIYSKNKPTSIVTRTIKYY